MDVGWRSLEEEKAASVSVFVHECVLLCWRICFYFHESVGVCYNVLSLEVSCWWVPCGCCTATPQNTSGI